MQHVVVQQHRGARTYQFTHCYENRGEAVRNLVEDTVERFNIRDDFEFSVCTEDHSHPGCDYHFSVRKGEYAVSFPQFLFDGWPHCGIANYEEVRKSLTDGPPDSNKLGWIGNPTTHWRRRKFLNDFSNADFAEGISNIWNTRERDAQWRNTPTYLSLPQQIQRWKYLLDIEGVGWSARLPLLLSSPRIVFIVERDWVEWWHEHLVPWKHFVPIDRDLSSLEEAYHAVESDEALQKHISLHQREFALRHLTRDAALERIRHLLSQRLQPPSAKAATSKNGQPRRNRLTPRSVDTRVRSWKDVLEEQAKPFRLVVASYSENLDWTQAVQGRVCIYDASGRSDFPGAIPIENRAREASQYLHHIITHYPDFHEWEIFVQGNPFDHCNDPILRGEPLPENWTPFQPLGRMAVFNPHHCAHDRFAAQFAREWFGGIPRNLHWVVGAQFAVHRKVILNRSLSYWQRLHAKTCEEHKTSPWALERLWFRIF